MSFLQVDKAIALTLLGLDPLTVLPNAGEDRAAEGQGFPFLAWDAQTNQPGAMKVGKRKVSFNGVVTQIDVLRFSPRGVRKIENYPAISFELVGCQYNPQRYIYKRDRFADPVATSMVAVTLADGKVVTGPSLRRTKLHPEPWDLMYDIRAWSKNNFESFALEQVILETFPGRGALFGVSADGTPRSWEMRISSINNVDDDEPTLTNREQREYSWVHTYVVETHLDNTLATQLVQTLTSEVELDVSVVPAVPVANRYKRVAQLSISPGQPTLPQHQVQQMTATATYTDGTTADVTDLVSWAPTDPTVLRVNILGQLIGLRAATTTLLAQLDGVGASTLVTVV